MTDLHSTPLQMEDQCLHLLQEVIYWVNLPEVREDPRLRELASRSGTLLQETTPLPAAHVSHEKPPAADGENNTEVAQTIHSLWGFSDAATHQRKKRRKKSAPEEESIIFLKAGYLSTAALSARVLEEAFPIRTPAGLAQKVTAALPPQVPKARHTGTKPPPLAAYHFRVARLANKGASAVRDAILWVPNALKGATPDLPVPDLVAPPTGQELAVSAAAAPPEIPASPAAAPAEVPAPPLPVTPVPVTPVPVTPVPKVFPGLGYCCSSSRGGLGGRAGMGRLGDPTTGFP